MDTNTNSNLPKFKPKPTAIDPNPFIKGFYFKRLSGHGELTKSEILVFKNSIVIVQLFLSEFDLAEDGFECIKTFKGKGVWLKRMAYRHSTFSHIINSLIERDIFRVKPIEKV